MRPELAFLEGPHGRLFAVRHGAAAPRRRVLIVPPFGDELNKCRALLTRTAAALAEAGCETLLLDLHGTGDSAGEFGAARFGCWIDELEFGLGCLPAGLPVGILALRTGALLLPPLISRHPAVFDYALLWQPVLSGEQFLKQLLRVRVMAAKFAGTDETVTGLQQAFARGESVEVAGYEIAPALADALVTARLTAGGLSGLRRVDVVEFTAGGEASLPVQQFVEAAIAAGIAARSEVVGCEQFWASQELAQPPAAVACAVRLCAAAA